MRKNREQTKQEEKVDGLQGANPVLPQVEGLPSGNSRDFFSSHFWSCADFQETKRLWAELCNSHFF